MGLKESSLAARDQNSPYDGFLEQIMTMKKIDSFEKWWEWQCFGLSTALTKENIQSIWMAGWDSHG